MTEELWLPSWGSRSNHSLMAMCLESQEQPKYISWESTLTSKQIGPASITKTACWRSLVLLSGTTCLYPMTQFSVFLLKIGLVPISHWPWFGGFVTQGLPCPSLLGWTAFPNPPSSFHLRGRQKQHGLINYLQTAAIRQEKKFFCCSWIHHIMGFPGNSAGKESTCNAEDPSSIPGLRRSTGEGIGYPL